MISIKEHKLNSQYMLNNGIMKRSHGPNANMADHTVRTSRMKARLVRLRWFVLTMLFSIVSGGD